MYIERVKIDISDRKENIKTRRNHFDYNIDNEYFFTISSAVVDHENMILHLNEVTFHNYLDALKKESEVIDLIEKNIDTIIYNYLL